MEGRIRLSNAELWLCRLVCQGRQGQKIYLAWTEAYRESSDEVGNARVPRKASKR